MIDSSFNQILVRASLGKKVFVHKVFDLSEQVNAYLAQRGWSRHDLAQKLGTTDEEVNKWLSGTYDLTLEIVARLEAALEADLLVTPRKPLGFFGS